MAKKGQKFIKIDKELKEQIIKEYLEGYSSYYLSKKYNISFNTIQTWGKIAKWPNKYGPKGMKRGRKKELNLTLEDWKERYEILKKYQAFLMAQREKR